MSQTNWLQPMTNGNSMTITYPTTIISSGGTPYTVSTDPTIDRLTNEVEDLKATNEDILEDLAVVVDILKRVAAKRIGKELKLEIEEFLSEYHE